MTTDRDLLRLAPCPFCGAEGHTLARGYRYDRAFEGNKEPAVACSTCTARATLKDWNTRAISSEPRAAPPSAAVREALRLAISHIEHMAAWITKINNKIEFKSTIYSFESLGEDMPGMKAALSGLGESSTSSDGAAPPFNFDRYINGTLMAEGVSIERQTTLEGAMEEAARIASRGPNGETPVLVLASAGADKSEDGGAQVSGHSEYTPVTVRGSGPSEATPSTAGSVREALERLLAYVDDLKAAMLTLGQPAVDPDGDVAFAKEALAALSAPVEAPVAVKPLEWVDLRGMEQAQAHGPFGFYVVENEEGWGFRFSDGPLEGCFAGPDAAKAAAQADFERRIRSALCGIQSEGEA